MDDDRGDGLNGTVEGWLEDVMNEAESANAAWVPGKADDDGKEYHEVHDAEDTGSDVSYAPTDHFGDPGSGNDNVEDEDDGHVFQPATGHARSELPCMQLPWTDEVFFANPRRENRHEMVEYDYTRVYSVSKLTRQRERYLGTEKALSCTSIICKFDIHKDSCGRAVFLTSRNFALAVTPQAHCFRRRLISSATRLCFVSLVCEFCV